MIDILTKIWLSRKLASQQRKKDEKRELLPWASLSSSVFFYRSGLKTKINKLWLVHFMFSLLFRISHYGCLVAFSIQGNDSTHLPQRYLSFHSLIRLHVMYAIDKVYHNIFCLFLSLFEDCPSSFLAHRRTCWFCSGILLLITELDCSAALVEQCLLRVT